MSGNDGSSKTAKDGIMSGVAVPIDKHISRLCTLQTLLTKYGAPGSKYCSSPPLTPVDHPSTIWDLHPHLFPIASSDREYFVCALVNTQQREGSPWPIVESRVGGLGYNLLALNSEHLMRRIACEADYHDNDPEIINIYNNNDNDDGSFNSTKSEALPYEPGSVAKLGYGLEKYVLLRVGPFPDLYRAMSRQHMEERKDECSALIAAETANAKFNGFASSLLSHAKLLASRPNRDEEVKDISRMCLRLDLCSLGCLKRGDFVPLARLAQLLPPNNNTDNDYNMIHNTEEGEVEEAMVRLQLMYEKIRLHELTDEKGRASMSAEDIAREEAKYLLDRTVLYSNKDDYVEWGAIREMLADIYLRVGWKDMAKFVNP